MDGSLQNVLQNGKADSRMKKVWMIKWTFGFVFIFIFLFLFIGIGFLGIIISSGPIGIIFYYIILPLIVGLLFSYIWASLYWNNYKFDIGPEKITITRGIIGKRIVNIPYERVQNVNIFRGVLERIYGIYSIEIETAGGFSPMSSGGYGTRMGSEGSIQGLIKPEPIADYIIAKSKGKESLGGSQTSDIQDPADRLKMLEERLLRGEISEKTYQELKNKYENM